MFDQNSVALFFYIYIFRLKSKYWRQPLSEKVERSTEFSSIKEEILDQDLDKSRLAPFYFLLFSSVDKFRWSVHLDLNLIMFPPKNQ